MKSIHPIQIFLSLSLATFLCFGCSTVKTVYEVSSDTVKTVKEKIGPDKKPVLKKKVMVPPIINQAKIRQERAEKLTKTMVEFLKQEPFLAITETIILTPSSLNIRSPEYGVIVDPELIAQARDQGMNVLITCTLNPFETTVKKTGIWPFRKLKREVEISFNMNAMDIATETLLLSETETEVIKSAQGVEEGRESQGEINETVPDKELLSMLKKLTERVIEKLNSHPWKGKILSADNNIIKIDGGKDIGIIKGNNFEVFSRGQKIKSFNGKEYYFLGPKVGEIRVEEVLQDYSLAVPIDGGAFEEGSSITIKR